MDIISLVVPCYNEEKAVLPFYKALKGVELQFQGKAGFEFVFIDDGSSDKTFEILKDLHNKDSQVKCISFSRNFGKEAALFSGTRAVTGDCAVYIDANLQHPPMTILKMYEEWKNGYEVVEGVKSDRGKDSLFHKLFTKIFYWTICKNMMMDMKNSSDFKLLDRKVVDAMSALKERNTFFRALSFWMGFKKTTVYYEVAERVAGASKWSTRSLIRYAIQNLISFTYAPLETIVLVGVVFILVGIGFGVDGLISYLHGKSTSGYLSLVFLILLGFGSVIVCIGFVAVYIAKIYDEIKGRPQYIERERLE